jgi:hypothetical protein
VELPRWLLASLTSAAMLAATACVLVLARPSV